MLGWWLGLKPRTVEFITSFQSDIRHQQTLQHSHLKGSPSCPAPLIWHSVRRYTHTHTHTEPCLRRPYGSKAKLKGALHLKTTLVIIVYEFKLKGLLSCPYSVPSAACQGQRENIQTLTWCCLVERLPCDVFFLEFCLFLCGSGDVGPLEKWQMWLWRGHGEESFFR